MDPRSETLTVSRLKTAKQRSGKSYSQIAAETGLTNVYVAQLIRRQAQLQPQTADKLRTSLPDLDDYLVEEMMEPPFRSYNPNLLQEPTVYRLCFHQYPLYNYDFNFNPNNFITAFAINLVIELFTAFTPIYDEIMVFQKNN